MKQENLMVRRKHKRKYNSYEITPVVENVIDRDFHATKPNQKWLTDITEFSIKAGKVYLSPIIDCLDGMPVSWTIGTSPNAELANTMLRNAIATLKPDEKPIVHSDRWCHYRWPEWIQIMEDANHIRSMSKKGSYQIILHARVSWVISKQKCFMDVIGSNIALKHLSKR